VLELAEAAGGDPPRPERPDVTIVKEIKALSGNEQLAKVFEQRDTLGQSIAAWSKTAKAIQGRLPRWECLNGLAEHASRLAEAEDANQQIATIKAERQLLADPDPIAPLCVKLTDILRQNLTALHSGYAKAHEDGMAALQATEAWSKIAPEDQQDILARNGLTTVPGIQVGTEAELVASLDGTSLEMWTANCDALPQRFQKAQREAARLIEPKVVYVALPSATIRTEAELEAWLTNVRQQIKDSLKNGPVGIG